MNINQRQASILEIQFLSQKIVSSLPTLFNFSFYQNDILLETNHSLFLNFILKKHFSNYFINEKNLFASHLFYGTQYFVYFKNFIASYKHLKLPTLRTIQSNNSCFSFPDPIKPNKDKSWNSIFQNAYDYISSCFTPKTKIFDVKIKNKSLINQSFIFLSTSSIIKIKNDLVEFSSYTDKLLALFAFFEFVLFKKQSKHLNSFFQDPAFFEFVLFKKQSKHLNSFFQDPAFFKDIFWLTLVSFSHIDHNSLIKFSYSQNSLFLDNANLAYLNSLFDDFSSNSFKSLGLTHKNSLSFGFVNKSLICFSTIDIINNFTEIQHEIFIEPHTTRKKKVSKL